jgi:FkbM family methyltransferase
MTALDLDYAQQIDSLLSESMESVLDRERNTFDCLIAPFNNRIVLFGAGNLGRRCLAALRGVGLQPLAFSDNNERLWNSRVDGLEVLPPAVVAERFGTSAVFVVTIWHLGHTFRDTHRQLVALRCREIVPFSPLRWKFPRELLPDYCVDSPHKVILAAENVRRASELWADDNSRREFVAELKWRLNGDHLALRPPSELESYFPDDIFTLTDCETFVDCGAYDGDTIKSFLKRRGDSFQRIYSFEPDRFNFAKVMAYLNSLNPKVAGKVELFDSAVGSKTCVLKFAANGSEGSSVCEYSEENVNCVSLDEVPSDGTPTYIKMDIEGFESEALMGARKCIERSRPVLAICVYHRQADLWQIPLLIRSFSPEYQMFLRIHESEGWQLVCYAVPPERVVSK